MQVLLITSNPKAMKSPNKSATKNPASAGFFFVQNSPHEYFPITYMLFHVEEFW